MEKKLLTIAQISKELRIPESTVRYYRDRFIDFVPYTGEGRNRRYRREAIEVFKFIAEGFNRNLTATDIEDGLSLISTRNIQFEEDTTTTTAVAQQQSNSQDISAQIHLNEQFNQLMEQMNVSMQMIANQKDEINQLRQMIKDLEEQNKQREDYIESNLATRDKELLEAIQRVESEVAASKENTKRWWKFW